MILFTILFKETDSNNRKVSKDCYNNKMVNSQVKFTVPNYSFTL